MILPNNFFYPLHLRPEKTTINSFRWVCETEIIKRHLSDSSERQSLGWAIFFLLILVCEKYLANFHSDYLLFFDQRIWK